MAVTHERQIRLAEQRRAFVSEALAAREEAQASGTGYDAQDVRCYVTARAAGRNVARPKARRWRG